MKFSNYYKYFFILVAMVFVFSFICIVYPIVGKEKTLVASAQKKDISQSILVSGFIEPKNKQEITIKKGSTVKKLYVEENTIVKKGTLLFELEENDSFITIKAKELELMNAEAELEKMLNTNLEREKKEKEIALKELELDIKEKSMYLKTMEESLNISKVMYEKGYISKKEMDIEQNNYDKALAELELLKSKYQIEKEKTEEYFENYKKDRAEKINALSKKIELLKLELNSLYKQNDEINTSSINGKVVKLNIDSGQRVDDEGPHIVIYDLSEIYVVFPVEQRYAPYIRYGDIAEITVPGLDKKIYGSVDSIDEMGAYENNSENPVVKVKVKIDSPNENIKIGFRANVKLLFNAKNQVVTVDYRAIVKDDRDNEFVYVLKDGIAEKTYVETGIKNDFEVEIIKGLIKGDQYIVNPSEDMRQKNSFRLWRYDLK